MTIGHHDPRGHQIYERLLDARSPHLADQIMGEAAAFKNVSSGTRARWKRAYIAVLKRGTTPFPELQPAPVRAEKPPGRTIGGRLEAWRRKVMEDPSYGVVSAALRRYRDEADNEVWRVTLRMADGRNGTRKFWACTPEGAVEVAKGFLDEMTPRIVVNEVVTGPMAKPAEEGR